MKDEIIVTIQGVQYALTISEAVAIRDSLCARLGCPSFCNKQVSEKCDGSINTTLDMELIKVKL